MINSFFNQHFITVQNLKPKDINLLFKEADKMKKIAKKNGSTDVLKGKVIACLFYEPSSRTFGSFVSAAHRVGASTIPILGMNTYTSVAKGETLEDTVRVFSCFANTIVMRHPQTGSAALASKYSYIPVINAGDGIGEHPTQSLLDSYTIHNSFPDFSKIIFCAVGDMKNGRTVHSNTKLLAALGVKKFIFVSPKILKMPSEIIKFIKSKGGKITEVENLDEVINSADVVYSTRVQKERFENLKEYEKLKHKYIITPATMKKAKKKMLLMHPLPRVGEITMDVDKDPRSVYMKEQMQNGLYIRMALLKLILRK